MSPRKANLESSIYFGSDGRWHGRVTMGTKNDGSPDRRHRSAKTETEIKRKVKELERQRDQGRAAKARSGADRCPVDGDLSHRHCEPHTQASLAR